MNKNTWEKNQTWRFRYFFIASSLSVPSLRKRYICTFYSFIIPIIFLCFSFERSYTYFSLDTSINFVKQHPAKASGLRDYVMLGPISTME